jgi:hypothetical protein
MINGSYNSFLEQVGYCKLQGYDTISRSTSSSPLMFIDGRVRFGVGLSDVQFRGSTSSCGRCLNVTRIQNFFEFNQQLTKWDYDRPVVTPFTAFVMDQCTDPICTTKYLDFDIYNIGQPVAYGNPYNIEWEYIPCPVENDTMELLLCLGPESCNKQDLEDRPITQLKKDAIDSGYWYSHVRSSRMPITKVDVTYGSLDSDKSYELEDNIGWKWVGKDADLGNDKWVFTIHSEENVTRHFILDWSKYNNTRSTRGYRGGVIISTDIQV